jgi:hypothetical protein
MRVRNEEGSNERQRYEPWITLVLLQALFAFSAWGFGLSKGEWTLGIWGICFAVFVEQQFDRISEQLVELECRMRATGRT